MKNHMLIKEYAKKIKLTNAQLVFDEMKDIKDESKEFFVAFYLDTKNKIIAREIIHIGTLNETSIHPREIFKGAILRSANSIIISHNHPSGDTTPSFEDENITKKLKEAGNLLGIPLLDHVIIGDNYYSFTEN